MKKRLLAVAGDRTPVPAGSPPGPRPTIVLKVVLMKKAIFGLTLGLAALGMWMFGSSGGLRALPSFATKDGGVMDPSFHTSTERGEAPSEVSLAGPERVPAPASRPATPVTAHAGATHGRLLIRVTHQEPPEPLADEVVVVRHHVSEGQAEDHLLRTDREGLARLAGLGKGRLRIFSVRAGEDDVWREIQPDRELEVSLHVAEGMLVRGQVVDSSGRGLPDAEVWLTEPWDRLRGHRMGRADAEGAFVIEHAQPFGHNWIGARASGRAASPWHYFEGRPGGEIELRIVLARPGATVGGFVYDGGGEPIPDAQLLLGLESADWTVSREGGPMHRTRSGSDGSFHFESVPHGPQRLLARAPGMGLYKGEVEVMEANPLHTIVLHPMASVSGRITDREGRPVPEARVHSGRLDTFASSQSSTAPDGRFRLMGLGEGMVSLTARKPWVGMVETSLVLTRGEALEWNAVLLPSPAIFGTIESADGPVPDVSVTVWVPVEGEPLQSYRTSDEAGRFYFDDLPARRHDLMLEVDPTRFVPILRHDILPSEMPLRLRLDDPATSSGAFTGRVLGPDGRAAGEALVHAEPLTRDTVVAHAEVDPQSGRFELRTPSDRCLVSVQAKGYPPLDLGEHVLGVGARLDLGTLQLKEPAFVRGTLSGIADDAIASLSLEWLDASERWIGSGEAVGLAFTSPPLPSGRIELLVRADFAEPRRLEFDVEPGEQRTETITLVPAQLTRVVLDLPSDTERPSRMWGEVQDEEGRLLWSADEPVPPLGELELRVFVRAGTWRIVGGTNTGLRARGEIVVPMGRVGSTWTHLQLGPD